MRRHPIILAMAIIASVSLISQALGESDVPSTAMSERILGDTDAELTIVEYASLTCPHCARFHDEVLPELQAKYIDRGKIKLDYRDFPLDQLALKAAAFARCVPEDQYFTFLHVLFDRQRNWSRDEDPIRALTQIGQLGGLDAGKLRRCMSDQELTDFILQQRLEAQQKHEINSTPTFLVNGEKVEGVQSFDQFRAIIESALK